MIEKKHLITTALPYVNGPIHIGHLAGVYVPADIYVRYLRMKEEDVVFIGGSDEHGIPITLRAKKEGVSPQEIADRYHEQIKKSFQDFGISFDNYSRTSLPLHHETAQDFFLMLHKNNVFIEEESEQFYDPEAGEFLADRYIVGTCPNCGNTNAYGDQCESCGTSLSPRELINPTSALSGAEPILKKTKHWYLPLDKYEEWLKQWILQGHKEDWKTNVYGQVKSWLDAGLKPRAITRDLDWGVAVPLENEEGKVLYVWFDAPIGYISSTQEWAQREGKNWEDYWKNPNTELIHFIGKDNIVFHSIIFPVMLKEYPGFILPRNIPANEFMNLENQKISTSRNWAVWLHEYLEDFPDKQDVLRYVLTANMPETKDNNFTWNDFQTKNNSELVGILGNFINRVGVLTQKYYDGLVPPQGTLTSEDLQVLDSIEKQKNKIAKAIEDFKFRDALQAYIDLARIGNKYLADQEPWKLIKTQAERVETILHTSLQITAAIAALSEPFLPFTAAKLKHFLGMPQEITWKEVNMEMLPPGHKIETPSLLFEKIEDTTIHKQLEKLEASKQIQSQAPMDITPQKESCQFDDFAKMDFRVGKVIEATHVPKTDKLLKLLVDTGVDTRTIVSGIAESYKPEDLIGRQVMVLLNLQPRKIKGIESCGMLLLAEGKDGKLSLMQPDKSVDPGMSIG